MWAWLSCPLLFINMQPDWTADRRSHTKALMRCHGGQVDNGSAAASSAAPSAAMAPTIPGEPISLLLKESVIVILQKDGGLDNMEVQGTIALQVKALL